MFSMKTNIMQRQNFIQTKTERTHNNYVRTIKLINETKINNILNASAIDNRPQIAETLLTTKSDKGLWLLTEKL